ncbi:hypothetical protein QOT17_007155 [Balamuthia mandrillaris]
MKRFLQSYRSSRAAAAQHQHQQHTRSSLLGLFASACPAAPKLTTAQRREHSSWQPPQQEVFYDFDYADEDPQRAGMGRGYGDPPPKLHPSRQNKELLEEEVAWVRGEDQGAHVSVTGQSRTMMMDDGDTDEVARERHRQEDIARANELKATIGSHPEEEDSDEMEDRA